MKVLAIANQKGGSAKTTTTVTLAVALGERGHRVLLLDMDPQCSATAWVSDLVEGDRAFVDALEGIASFADQVKPSSVSGVDVIPGSAYLGALPQLLAETPGPEMCLVEALSDLKADAYDVALIDCPPTMGLLVFAAMAASDSVLAPVEVSPMAVAGLDGLVKRIDKVRRRLNEKLDLVGVLSCRVNDRTVLSRDVVATLDEDFPGKLFKVGIREGVRVREAWAWKQSLLEFDPKGNASEDYRAAALELETRLGLMPVGDNQ